MTQILSSRLVHTRTPSINNGQREACLVPAPAVSVWFLSPNIHDAAKQQLRADDVSGSRSRHNSGRALCSWSTTLGHYAPRQDRTGEHGATTAAVKVSARTNRKRGPCNDSSGSGTFNCFAAIGNESTTKSTLCLSLSHTHTHTHTHTTHTHAHIHTHTHSYTHTHIHHTLVYTYTHTRTRTH